MADLDLTRYDGHTRGPWRISIGASGANGAMTVRDGAEHPIAELWLTGAPKQERIANGRLTADAPLLLAETKRLHGELAAIRKAARDMLDTLGRPGENACEKADRVAATFYRDTGKQAPWKDRAAACNDTTSYEDRRAEYDAWWAERHAALAKLANWPPTHRETIRCPECGKVQVATVRELEPWDALIHDCDECGHLIMESEWERVDEALEQLAKEPTR